MYQKCPAVFAPKSKEFVSKVETKQSVEKGLIVGSLSVVAIGAIVAVAMFFVSKRRTAIALSQRDAEAQTTN